jgi:hypothetical protein
MSKCNNDCLACRRAKCLEIWPTPGEPRPEEPDQSTSRVDELEECLRLCRSEIIRSAGDTVWITHHETLVDYIGTVLADDTQGELFNKNADQD